MIIAKASVAYPNQIPDLEENPSYFELWCEMLSDVDAQLGLSNLNQHILTSNFPPLLADIAKQPEQDNNPYADHKQLTQKHFVMLEEAKTNAVPMPDHIRKALIGDV